MSRPAVTFNVARASGQFVGARHKLTGGGRMLRLCVAIILLLSAPSLLCGQTKQPQQPAPEQLALQKNSLLADLRGLDTEATKLSEALARAAAKAEIADAAWELDQPWAKQLLREAYELTLPAAEDREKWRGRTAGSDPVESNKTDLARSGIRSRVLGIAQRDQALAAQLTAFGAQQLGKQEEVQNASLLGVKAMAAGDTNAASEYLLQAIEADPTQITVGLSILELAAQDRGLADKLLLKYIERLRNTPLTQNAALRTYVALRRAVFPNANADPKRRQILPAGREVVRAYVSYVLDSLTWVERSAPGSARNLRGFLLSVWLPLNEVAPELTGAFLELEKLARGPDDSAELPTQKPEEASNVDYEERLKKALNSREPKALEEALNYALGRGDFKKAREILGLLSSGETKDRFTEELNIREALSLVANDETAPAAGLAAQLKQPESILRTYPALIQHCVKQKDNPCASSLVYQALKQLKGIDDGATRPLILSRLAAAIATADATLALEVLDESVRAANSSAQDTGDGRTNLYLAAFALLAPKDEARVRQNADSLKDRLKRISVLAVIYRWKAQELTKLTKPPVTKQASSNAAKS